jgi:hypothetical protein
MTSRLDGGARDESGDRLLGATASGWEDAVPDGVIVPRSSPTELPIVVPAIGLPPDEKISVAPAPRGRGSTRHLRPRGARKTPGRVAGKIVPRR